MSEQPTQDQSEFPAASVDIPETLHIDLPEVNQDKVLLILCENLVLISKQDWELLVCGHLSCKAVTVLAFLCMDIIQTFAEAIVDAMMPQVYRFMRTYGTFPSTIIDLNEDQIEIYLGDSIEQGLCRILKTNVQNFTATKNFLKLLVRTILKTVNAVLALTTEAPIQDSRFPVVFVSGCVTSVEAHKEMVCQLASMLTKAFNSRVSSEEETEAQLDSTTLSESMEEEEEEENSTVFNQISEDVLKDSVMTYITRMVNVLKRKTQRPYSEMKSRNDIETWGRTDSNIKMLTVEDTSESYWHFLCSSPDSIEGKVPDSTDSESPSEGFGTVKVMGKNPATEVELINDITEKLVETFWKNKQEAEQIDNFPKAVLGGLEDADFVKLKELTSRIFDIIMSGQDYQIPLVPAGLRMCDTVTYSNVRQAIVPNAYTLYMWAEEVTTRCALLTLLWSALNPECWDYECWQYSFTATTESSAVIHGIGDQRATQARNNVPVHRGRGQSHVDDESWSLSPQWSGSLSSMLSFNSPDFPLHWPLVLRPWTPPMSSPSNSDLNLSRPGTGEHTEGEHRPASTSTYYVPALAQEPRLSQLVGRDVEASLPAPMVREMLPVIAIGNNDMISNVVQATLERLENLDPEMHHHFHDSLMGQSYEDISQRVIADLLEEFGSVQVMQEMVRSGDLRFNEAVVSALMKQLTIPISDESATKKTDCGFFKKFKRVCRKKTFTKANESATVIPLTTKQSDGKKEKQESRRGFLRKTAASFRNIFSSVAKKISKPFIACCCCSTSE